MKKYEFFKELVEKDKDVGVVLRLNRSDLKRGDKEKPIEEISIFNFSATSVTLDTMAKCAIILFDNGDGQYKELKNRYASWPLK